VTLVLEQRTKAQQLMDDVSEMLRMPGLKDEISARWTTVSVCWQP
jgi:hypothetical protein